MLQILWVVVFSIKIIEYYMKYKQLILGIIIGVVGCTLVLFFDYTGGEVKELHVEVKGIGGKPYAIWHSNRTCSKIEGVILKSEKDTEEIRKTIKSEQLLCNKCITDKMIERAKKGE